MFYPSKYHTAQLFHPHLGELCWSSFPGLNVHSVHNDVEIHVGVSAIRGRGKRYQFQLILFNHLMLCSPQHPFQLRLCASCKWLNAYKKTSVSFPSLSSLTSVCEEFWMRCNFWLWAKNTCSCFRWSVVAGFCTIMTYFSSSHREFLVIWSFSNWVCCVLKGLVCNTRGISQHKEEKIVSRHMR